MIDRVFDDGEESAGALPTPTVASKLGPGPDQDMASIRQSISELGSLSVERRRFLAGYAYVLMRVARVDADINTAETRRMEQAVTAAGKLPEALGVLLVALAGRLSSLYGASEDYAVTREVARTASPQERQRLMRACVAVGTADGRLTDGEAVELREVGRELGFSVDEIEAIRDQVDPFLGEPLESGSRRSVEAEDHRCSQD